MTQPQTIAAKAWIADLEERRAHWSSRAQGDEMSTFDRLAAISYRDCYDKFISEAKSELVAVEREATE
jgi:hypothetical protein